MFALGCFVLFVAVVKGQQEPCNHAAKGCVRSSTWIQEGYDGQNSTIVIPCGVCVTMDTDASHLLLPFGLDIQGTLLFTKRYRDSPLTIETPFVSIQGKLSVRSFAKVTGDPHLTLRLTESTRDCAPLCTGPKSVTIHGGQLDIRAFRNQCRTWVSLQDVVVSKQLEVIRAESYEAVCSAEFRADFTRPTPEWSAGSKYDFTSQGTLLVSERSEERYGPLMDLNGIRRCFVAGQTYLLRARIRLSSTATGKTTCARRNKHCLRMQTILRLNGETVGRRKGAETSRDEWEYNRWEEFMASFTFSKEELVSNDVVSHVLLINGVEPGVDVEMDHVSLEIAPTYEQPDNICKGNLIINGNAKAADHIYPMEVFGSARLRVQNGFFRVDLRENNLSSIAYFAKHCIVPGGRYRVSAKLRIRLAPLMVKSWMTFRLGLPDGSLLRRDIASCPPSQGEWVVCESEFLIGDDFEQYDTARFAFETEEGTNYPFDVTDWVVEFQEVASPFILVQEDGVKGCWGKGAEVLITSHTNNFESAQTRRLVANPVSTGDGFVRLKLDRWIRPPVTEKDGDGFAVEVALLSRNVLFEGVEDASKPHLGGHLIVMATPKVKQRLQGVEFRNFGRQGELGRYPIHFHMSENVQGSVVKQNTIRKSKQRCIVIHGSHNVTVSDNVAYETEGHCYMLEDGGELDNVFFRNLGASTRAAQLLVRPFETDGSNPSTFWISNPRNSFVKNVAAGSESSGFWFELNREVRPPTLYLRTSVGMVPRTLPLTLFKDNVAHSNVRHGLRTYPNGFEPPKQAVFHNTRSYKNMLAGVFLHNTENILLLKGTYADNSIQIDLDRADRVDITDSVILGSTARFKEIVEAEDGIFGTFTESIGIQLHSFRLDESQQGSNIRGIQFADFDGSLGARSALIDVDEKKQSGVFDYWTSLENITVDGRSRDADFDFSKARENGVVGIFVTDKDGSLNFKTSGGNSPSAIISSSPQMTTFIDTTKCFDSSARGYLYCPDLCLRNFLFKVGPSSKQDLLLRVNTPGGLSVDYEGKFHFEYHDYDSSKPNDFANTWIKKLRSYSVTLPTGEFSAEFIDSASGETQWPDFVQVVPQKPQCSPSLSSESLDLSVPPLSNQECSELIKNGNLEMSEYSTPHWLHHMAGINLLKNRGIGGSNAMIDTTSRYPDAYFGQYIDTRCLVEGAQFVIKAWVKLVAAGTSTNVACTDGEQKGCPSLKLSFRLPGDDLKFEHGLSIGDFFVRPFDDNSWNMLQSTLTIDSRLASAEFVALTIQRGAAGVNMIADDVSMTPVSDSCDELIFNGDFSLATTAFWEKQGSVTSAIDIIRHSVGNAALKHFSRSTAQDLVVQHVKTGCIHENRRYKAFARVRLLGEDGRRFECDRHGKTTQRACPTMQLQSTTDLRQESQQSKFHFGGKIADVDYGIDVNGWFTMSGIFYGTWHDERSERSKLMIGGPLLSTIYVIIDDVSISPLRSNCAELLINGNAEDGDTARFWRMAIPKEASNIAVVNENDNKMFIVSDRTIAGDGMVQVIDKLCLRKNSSWLVTAKMKIRSRTSNSNNDEYVRCETASTRMLTQCPTVRIHGMKDGTKSFDEVYRVTMTTWKVNSWNEYEVAVNIPEDLASYDQVWFGIRSYNTEWDLIVDDLSMARR